MEPKTELYSRLTVDIPDYLHRKLKGYAAFRKTHIRVLVARMLYEGVKTLEREIAKADMEPEEWDPGF